MHSINTLREYARQYNIPIISAPTEQIIKSLIKRYKPQYILEIGSAIGYSTLVIADEVKKHNSQGIVYSFEVSLNSYLHLLSNLAHFNQYLSVVKPFNFNFLSYPNNLLPKFDFVFIDAQKSLYLEFFKKAYLSTKSSGIIVVDDVGAFPCKTNQLIKYLKKHTFNFKLIPSESNDKVLIVKF